MKKFSKLLIALGLLVLLNACVPINNEFTCDKTAMDGCMDMGPVDDKSQDGTTIETWTAKNQLSEAQLADSKVPPLHNANQRIWVAPYTDSAGQYHGESFVYVNLDKSQGNASHD